MGRFALGVVAAAIVVGVAAALLLRSPPPPPPRPEPALLPNAAPPEAPKRRAPREEPPPRKPEPPRPQDPPARRLDPPPWPATGPGLRVLLKLPAEMEVETIHAILRPEAGGEIPGTPGERSVKALAGRSAGYAIWREGLPPGRYRLSLGAYERARHREVAVVEFAGGEEPIEVRVDASPRAGMLFVQAIGPDGRPLRPDRIHATYSEAGVSLAYSQYWAMDPEGVCRIRFEVVDGRGEAPPPFDPEKGRIWVRVRTKYGVLSKEVVPSAEPEATIRFQESGHLIARFEGVLDSPYKDDLFVHLAEAGPEGRFLDAPDYQVHRFGRTGRLELESVQPGEYSVVVRRFLGEGSYELMRAPVTVGTGKTEVQLQLRPLHKVAFRSKQWPLVLERLDNLKWKRTPPSPTKGDSSSLDGLPDGHYRVSATRLREEFVLPGIAEIELR